MIHDQDNQAVCKVCNKTFQTNRQLHSHVKVHSLRIVEYYQKHYPRHDIYNKEIIKFKTREQYFSTDFNSRNNLRLWLKDRPEDEVVEYCKSFLLKRKEKKKLTYSPSQVELRTVLSPPIQYLEKIFKGYYKQCEGLGFKNKYQFPTEMIVSEEHESLSYSIWIDTREQLPLKFENSLTETKTLPVGDYALNEPKLTCNCYIERKSLADFVSTLSVRNLERFEKEIIRATEIEAKLIILIEDSLENAVKFNYLPYISKKIQATPEYIFHNVRELIQKYQHIQFLFVKGRQEAERVVKKIFFSRCSYEKIDLQLAYDIGVL